MTNTNEPRALSMLLRERCGLDGETAGAFMAELKKLTDKDRADFRAWFEAEGIAVK